MRFRRRSRRRVEPITWIRGCALQSLNITDLNPENCDDSPVQGGVVLFDPSIALVGAGGLEQEFTVLKVRFPSVWQFNTTGQDQTREWALWNAVVLSGGDDANLLVATLGDLLNGGTQLRAPADLLHLEVLGPWGNTNSTAGIIHVDGTAGNASDTQYQRGTAELNVKRKVRQDERIIMLWGIQPLAGSIFDTNHNLVVSTYTVVSTLYQRTVSKR